MLSSCRFCGRTHPIGMACPSKPKPKTRSKGYATAKANKFHDSNEWAKVRGRVVLRDFHLCRVCHAGGKYLDLTRGRAKRLEVHHIVKLVDDFSLRAEDSNLITLCPEHHRMADSGLIPAWYLRDLAGNPIDWAGNNPRPIG